jgi:hypothetical protein
MGTRKGQFLIRLSEKQAQTQCNSHPIPSSAVSLLQSPGTALVDQLLKEQKIPVRSWTWAAFWTTFKPGSQPSGLRVDHDCGVLEVIELKRD